MVDTTDRAANGEPPGTTAHRRTSLGRSGLESTEPTEPVDRTDPDELVAPPRLPGTSGGPEPRPNAPPLAPASAMGAELLLDVRPAVVAAPRAGPGLDGPGGSAGAGRPVDAVEGLGPGGRPDAGWRNSAAGRRGRLRLATVSARVRRPCWPGRGPAGAAVGRGADMGPAARTSGGGRTARTFGASRFDSDAGPVPDDSPGAEVTRRRPREGATPELASQKAASMGYSGTRTGSPAKGRAATGLVPVSEWRPESERPTSELKRLVATATRPMEGSQR
jgi:hypothetical protein